MGKLGYNTGGGLTIYPEKVINITYAAPRETILGTPEVLPSALPTDPNVSFTVLNSDLPTFNVTPVSVKYAGTVLVGGKNNSASSKTVSYAIIKNGTTIRNGSSSVAAGSYYCIDAYNFFDVNVGDNLALKIYCDSTVDISYKSIFVQPTRLQTESNTKHKLITDLCFVIDNNQFDTSNTTNYNTFACYAPTGNDLYTTKFENMSLWTEAERGYIPIGIHDKIKGLYMLEGGDYSQNNIMTFNTALPYKYNRNVFPIQIKYKPTNYTFD